MEGRSRAESGVTRDATPRQRLYLVTPRIEDPARFVPDVERALAAGDIAAVLLRLADGDERKQIECVKAITPAVQRRDVALLLDGHAAQVARTGADGAHISGIEAFVAALPLLKPDRIAGAGGLSSRHDAMLAGESGADYVMFGEPDRRDRRPSFEELEERLLWWVEILEIPCVGYAGHPDEVAALARTGADFIALGEWIWTWPQGAAAAVANAAEQLQLPAPR
jgi:thiamine-phosphate pyrophosphorylase